jgi:hypothetical protein
MAAFMKKPRSMGAGTVDGHAHAGLRVGEVEAAVEFLGIV